MTTDVLDLQVGDEVYYYDPEHFNAPRPFYLVDICNDEGVLTTLDDCVELGDFDDPSRELTVAVGDVLIHPPSE